MVDTLAQTTPRAEFLLANLESWKTNSGRTVQKLVNFRGRCVDSGKEDGTLIELGDKKIGR